MTTKLNWYRDYDGILRAEYCGVLVSIEPDDSNPDHCAIIYSELEGVSIDCSGYTTEEEAQQAAQEALLGPL